jgi:hypothetical protein
VTTVAAEAVVGMLERRSRPPCFCQGKASRKALDGSSITL